MRAVHAVQRRGAHVMLREQCDLEPLNSRSSCWEAWQAYHIHICTCTQTCFTSL